MKEAFTFLTAVAVLAVAQTLTTALGIVLLILALMGVVAFPRRTFQFFASLGLLVLALKEPAACISALAAVAVAAVVGKRLPRQPEYPPYRGPVLLPKPDQSPPL